jgi:hypothetical protein
MYARNMHIARSPYVYTCVIYKEGLCPSSGAINRLMMMMNIHPWKWDWHDSARKFRRLYNEMQSLLK